MMNKLNFVHFLVLIINFKFVYNNNYIFEIETVKEISLVPVNGDIIPTEEIFQNHLYKLSLEEKWNLCANIGKYASLMSEVVSHTNLDPMDKYEIVYLDGTTGTVVALICPTEPVTLLRMGNSDSKIHIMLEDQFLLPYRFEMQVVKYVRAIEEFPEQTVLRNDLCKLNPEEQRHLCAAAKMYASIDGMESNDAMNKVTGCEITYLDNKRTTFVALPCPTSPPVYLRLAETDEVKIVSSNEFLMARYTFYKETVESALKLRPEEGSYLSSLNGGKRWQLCIAAKERVGMLLPVYWSKPFQNVDIYEIQTTDGKRINRVAFPCSTAPKNMMLISSRNRTNKFTVMLIKHPNPPLG